MRRLATIAATLTFLAVPAAAAHAAFPGMNGKIAYLTSSGHLFTINPDGSGASEVPLPPDDGCVGRQGVSWTSNGALLAIGDCSRMAILAPDGSGFRTVGSGLRMGSWAPDSSRLVYGNNPVCFCYISIRRVNADGTGDMALVNTDGDFNAEWSPDGTLIAYSTSQGIYTTDPNGQLRTPIPNTARGDVPESWSPDGSRLAFTREYGNGTNDIYSIRKDGSGLEQLTSDGHSGPPSWSPDGTKIVFGRANDLYVMNADGSDQTRLTTNADAFWNDWQPIPYTYTHHVHPKGAGPFQTYLVPAYKQCTAPNRMHGAPLDSPSCSPPQQTSDYLTLGTMDANGQPAGSTGLVKFAVRPQDVLFVFVITDVRNKSDLSDYTGGLQEIVNWRLTDHYNGPSLTESATMLDVPFPANMPCGATITDAGATCGLQTSANAVVPGAVKAGKRAVVELGQVQVYDGGADGDPSTAPNTLFLDQGIFVP